MGISVLTHYQNLSDSENSSFGKVTRIQEKTRINIPSIAGFYKPATAITIPNDIAFSILFIHFTGKFHLKQVNAGSHYPYYCIGYMASDTIIQEGNSNYASSMAGGLWFITSSSDVELHYDINQTIPVKATSTGIGSSGMYHSKYMYQADQNSSKSVYGSTLYRCIYAYDTNANQLHSSIEFYDEIYVM